MNLTGFALRNQPLVLIIVAALVAYSVSVLDDFPSQEDPPITVREAVVVTFAPGMEAEDVELLVTSTIEQARETQSLSHCERKTVRWMTSWLSVKRKT